MRGQKADANTVSWIGDFPGSPKPQSSRRTADQGSRGTLQWTIPSMVEPPIRRRSGWGEVFFAQGDGLTRPEPGWQGSGPTGEELASMGSMAVQESPFCPGT